MTAAADASTPREAVEKAYAWLYERCKDTLVLGGECSPVFVGFDRSGKALPAYTDGVEWVPKNFWRQLQERLVDHLQEAHPGAFVAFVSEAWVIKRTEAPRDGDPQPSECDDREEHVIISLMGDGWQAFVSCPIERTPRVALKDAPLSFIGDDNVKISGRFIREPIAKH